MLLDMTMPERDGIFSDDEMDAIQQDFQRLRGTIYLDHTGAALYPESVIRKVNEDLLCNCYANPHSGSASSRLTIEAIDQIRFRLLEYFKADPNEYSIVFTSGATAALKMVAEAFNFCEATKMQDDDGWHPVPQGEGISGSLVYLEQCHTSVLGMRSLVEERGADVVCITQEKAFDTFVLNTKENGDSECRTTSPRGNSLFVYPAQCNFSGFKYPLEWIEQVHAGRLSYLSKSKNDKWYCLLDAATYLSSSLLDLNRWKPDFVSMSMYKIFGYPTGLGALIVRNSSADVLMKRYYGGGTVFVALSDKNEFVPRSNISNRFEDGTLNYLSIISLHQGLNWIHEIDMKRIGRHVHALAAYTVSAMQQLQHPNGASVVRIYADTDYSSCEKQGGVVNFNILNSSSGFIGFAKVMEMANLHNIQLRTGCFCNPGACRRHLGLTEETVRHHFKSGHVCGDDNDLIDGEPTGSVRVSFGPYSTFAHADVLIRMLAQCFVSSSTPFAAGSLLQHHTVCEKVFGKLEEISLYPVKSCAKFSVSSWPMDTRGLKYDRMWMVCDNNGVAVTQKKEPRLCFIKPIVDLEKGFLQLTAKGQKDYIIPLHNDIESKAVSRSLCRTSKVCQDAILGFDCGNDVAKWLETTLGRSGLRLLRLNHRKGHADLSLVNQSQYLLVNKSSVEWLTDHTDSSVNDSLVNRFRANFIVDRVGEPFSELTWTALTIGKASFSVDGSCRRCEMICIDQETAERSKEPLRTLVREVGKLQFGIYLSRSPKSSIIISVGDAVIPQLSGIS